MNAKLFYLLMVLLMSGCVMLGDRTFNISDNELQQKLNEKIAIPFSLLKIFDVNLSNSFIKFDSSTGRMYATIDTQFSSKLNNKIMTGKLVISGKLRFDATSSAIVLDDSKVESLDLDKLDGRYTELFNLIAQKLGGEMLNGLQLYKVKKENLRIGTTLYSPTNMQITDKGLQITLSPIK